MQKTAVASRSAIAICLAALASAVLLSALPGNALTSGLKPEGPTILPDHRWAHFVQRSGGLASNSVWSIVAADDAVWFGTDRGISRYNGVWATFTPTNDYKLGDALEAADPSVSVLTLAAGDEGKILAGTSAGEILNWDGESWVRTQDIGVAVLALAELNGVLYAGAEDGLYTFPLNGDEAQLALEGGSVFALGRTNDSLYAGTQDGLWRLRDEKWVRVAPIDRRLRSGIYAISETGTGDLAVGTPDGVLIFRDAVHGTEFLPVRDELDRPALVQSLAEDLDGRLWAGTDGAGAHEFAPLSHRATIHGQANDANVTIRYIRDIAVDADGSVWFATPTGVYRYQVGMWHSDIQGESVADPLNHVNDMLVTREGELWIATGGGGVRVKTGINDAETVYSVDDDLPSTVLVLEEDALGTVWAGAFYGLFRFVDGEWQWPAFNADLPDLTVTSLLGEEPYLWIGTESGLARYDTRDESLSNTPEFEDVSIEALALDGLQRLWVGTNTHGVFVREVTGEWTAHEYEPADVTGLPGNWIIGSGLAADWRTAGDMWALVFQEGLAHWDGGGWTVENAEGQIPDNLLWTLLVEAEPGRLWVGSEGGVTQYDGWTWGTLSQDDGLQSASTFAVTRVQDGGYWIGGATGLSYYRPDRTPPWVKINSLSDKTKISIDGIMDVPVDEELVLGVSAGDLQTLQQKLIVLQRLVGPDSVGAWEQQTPGTIAIDFPEPGPYELQIVARDQSFNYSEMARLPIDAFVPPPTVHVPGLGQVAPNTFRALALLGSISLLGAGYILFEVMQQRQRSIEALNRGFNPYISGEPVRRQDMFYGRRDLVQRIVDMLHNNSVMIHGERRIGKTTLLYQLTTLLREVDDSEYWFAPVYVDMEGTREHDFFHFLIEEIAQGVSRLPDAPDEILPHVQGLQFQTVAASKYDDRAFHRDLQRVVNVLDAYGDRQHTGKQLRLILLLDEMDVMSQYDSLIQQQLRRIFMREFAFTVGAVVAGIRISKDWDRVESPWYNMFNEIALEPFSEDEAQALLTEPVEGYYRYEDDAVEYVLDHSEGRPYRIQQYGLEAVNHMLACRRRTVKLEDALEAHQRIEATVSGAGIGKPSVTPDDAHAALNETQGR